MIVFGELLDRFRRQRGISKKELAERAGLSGGYVSLLISGGKQNPSADVTAALAQVLTLSAEEMDEFWRAAGYDEPLVLPGSIARLGRSSQRARRNTTAFSPQEAGIVGVYQGLPLDLVRDWLASAENRRIRIQDTAMVDGLLGLESAFLAASKERGMELQVLLLAAGPIAVQRSRDVWPPSEPVDEDYVANKIRASIGELKRWSAKGLKLHLKTYEAVPSFQLFASDERALIGFFQYGERAFQGPQIEIEGRSTQLCQFVNNEFDKLWDRARTEIDTTEN